MTHNKNIKPRPSHRPALRMATVFFVFGFLWILLSDALVNRLAPSFDQVRHLQTIKGWLFIITTTILIYVLAKKQIKKVRELATKYKQSQQQYKQILDVTHDLIWATDHEGKIIYVNEASIEVYGYKPHEMIDHYFNEFVSEEQFEKNSRIFSEAIQQGILTVDFETEITDRNGRSKVLSDRVILSYDEEGKPKMLVGASMDITAYRIFEKKLLDNNERLELAMHGGGIGLWDYWFQSQKLIVNEHFKEISGMDVQGDVISIRKLAPVIHPDDRAAFIKAFNPVTISEEIMDADFRIRHSEGKYRWVSSRGKITERNSDGIPTRMMGAITDITKTKELELQLKNLVEIYSSFIRYSSEGIYLYEMDPPMPVDLPVDEQIKLMYHAGYLRTCNNAFASMYGHASATAMEGLSMATMHGSDDDPDNISLLREFITGGYSILKKITKENDKDGNLLYISNNVVGITENGKLLRTWGSQSNITQQVLALENIEESEKRYRLIFKTNPVPLLIFKSDDLRILDVNQAACKLFGYTQQEFISINVGSLRDGTTTTTDLETVDMMMQHPTHTAEMMFKTKTGILIPADVKLDKIEYRDTPAFLAAITDLTAVKNAEKMVIQSLIEGADTERIRVAKEIHDSLGQNLTAVSLNLNSIETPANLMGEKNAERFANGLRFLKNAIEESRNIAHNLMPKAIEDFGLVLSLHSLFNQIEKTSGLKIDFFQNMGDEMRLDKQIELNLYRITQEALNNVLKHAGATEVFVQLILHPTEIIFTFEDNGKGFDKLNAKTSKKGIGLKNIANRAIAMSGHADIDSSIGQGTTITIVIPRGSRNRRLEVRN
jgi:PAS domain S-box-containing protein